MNYRKIYADIIRRAKERPKPNCYTERHHIVPKSLGGSNEKDNIVILTARESISFAIGYWLRYMQKEQQREEKWCMLFSL